MDTKKRLKPLYAAKQFIDKNFPNCQGALLAGSVVRGEDTDTSDLDIVIFDDNILASYRQSIMEFEWAIEVFVHNLSSYKQFFEEDSKRARPSLPRMISEGIIIRDLGVIQQIKREANIILSEGPEIWNSEIIQIKRYFITDVLDDFIGSTTRAEELMIANTLTDMIQEFVLRSNGCWIGSSKWIIRELNNLDKLFASQFVDALDTFYKKDDKSKIIDLVDQILQPYGGRLFEGFRLDSK
ncbi:nucleotidyltransferase domain-containing protein [Ureibacillus sinduriensis]|uniref:Nucleotidyltransferase n=1 Tax=Ureibacillus sinduriensis BLB-1 = JCM 15800 TaxID=1384057 RepID=A0A0A3I6B5_9BACL|nr:nucleotidyltransferase domain-containing protein [Ureibacillus sinduriensis]KGR78238.1 nucleotidyltransferase [Ureibacillus sinduriensis BLB-1 = JCM 15800]